jgi:hypothetical protein
MGEESAFIVAGVKFNDKRQTLPKGLREELEAQGKVIGGSSLDLSVLDEETSLLEVSPHKVDQILIDAEILLDTIEVGANTLGKLTDRQKQILMVYFYMFNPYFRRIVNIFTRLPLSYLSIQKPKTDNSIIQDYIYNFFNRMLERAGFQKAIRQLFLYYFLFGSAYLLVEDNFEEEGDTQDIKLDDYPPVRLETLKVVKEGKIKVESIEKVVRQIVEDYNVNKHGVSKQDMTMVINLAMHNWNPNYKGIKRMRVVNPLEIKAIRENREIDFVEIDVESSKFIAEAMNKVGSSLSEEDALQGLIDLGYTSEFIKRNLNNAGGVVSYNSDPMESVYVLELKTSDLCGIDLAFLDSILNDCIDYHRLRIRQKERIKNMGKKMVLLSPNEDHTISFEQMERLRDEAIASFEVNDTSIVVTNFSVSPDEIDLTAQDKIDVEGPLEIAQNNMSVGSGTPIGMISGDDSYGGNYLKMEVLTEEFFIQRSELSEFVENKIFKPIAAKKGFIVDDGFNNWDVIIPKLNFKIGTIVNSTEFRDLLKDLADGENIPYGLFLQYIGLDPEDIYQDLARERVRKEEIDEVIATQRDSLRGEAEPKQPPPEEGEEPSDDGSELVEEGASEEPISGSEELI